MITGEGQLDATSFAGKVVGGVAEIAADMGIPVLAVVGSIAEGTNVGDLEVLSLVDLVGEDTARREPKQAIEQTVADWLTTRR